MRYSECLTCYARGLEIWHECDVTKINEGSCIVYITEKLARQHAQNTTSGLFAAASLLTLVLPDPLLALYAPETSTFSRMPGG